MIKPITCKNCGKTLMEADIKEGVVLKDCPKCGVRNEVRGGATGMVIAAIKK
jgi:phage FluMu protein Com